MEFSKSKRALKEELTQILTMSADEPSIDFWEITVRGLLAQIAISVERSSADHASRS